MIYITGDVHCPIDVSKLNMKHFSQQKHLNRNDVLIVLGDFGLVWQNNSTYRYWLKWFTERNYTLVFIDGNHENHDWLNSFPIEQRYNAPVHIIADNIFHLMRGYVYEIGGKTWFAFGGAMSIDRIQRIPYVSWWPSEVPNSRECERGMKSLDAVNWKVNHVITHTAPLQTLDIMFPQHTRMHDPTEEYLETIRSKLDFEHWWFGHWHFDTPATLINDKPFTAMYDDIQLVN